MSKLFRFSESLGESNGKKWSQIYKKKTFAYKGCKIAVIFFGDFALQAGFFGIGATICICRELLFLPFAFFVCFVILV